MRYLGIDFGAKRIGLSICDPAERLVSPLETIDRRDDLQSVRRIAKVVADEGVGAIVVGLPINMDDSEGPQVQRVRQFAELLAQHVKLPLHFQNEQLSSFAADQRLAARDLTKAGNRRRQDAIAAAVILEDFLRAQAK